MYHLLKILKYSNRGKTKLCKELLKSDEYLKTSSSYTSDTYRRKYRKYVSLP